MYPMHQLIKKGKNFDWTSKAHENFVKLKGMLSSSPVLALPVDDGHYLVDTDASEVALALMLHQEPP